MKISRVNRRALTLVEVLITSAIMLVVCLLIANLLGGSNRLKNHTSQHVIASSAIQTVTEHYASYPFTSLDALNSGHGQTDDALKDFLIALPEDLADQTSRKLNPRVKMRFQRILPFNELGLLHVGVGWVGQDGRKGVASIPRFVIDETLFAPIYLPQNAEELGALAESERTRRELEEGFDEEKNTEATSKSARATQEWIKRRTQGHTHYRTHSGHGHGDAPDPLAGNKFTKHLDDLKKEAASRQRAGQQYDQIMEMLHDLYHAEDDGVHTQDAIASLRKFASHNGDDNLDWDSLSDPRLSSDFALSKLVDMLDISSIPDGDYLYDFQMESTALSAGSSGMILVCYRLRSLKDQKRHLLLKEVKTDSKGLSKAFFGSRPVVNCGDRQVTEVLPTKTSTGDMVKVKNLFGHLEATSTKLFFFRPSVDSDGNPEPLEQVVSIRTFPTALECEKKTNEPYESILIKALKPLLTKIGAGTSSLDARESGVDTKMLFGW